MRSWLKKTILDSGALRVAAGLRGPSVAILMYHSILPDPSLRVDWLGGIIHSELAFRAQMELLARDFVPISLDRALKYVRGSDHLPKRSVVVTFDDGYADNYEVAVPVLDQVGVPATFYVTVDCVEHRRIPWPSRLRFAFRNTKLRLWTDPLSKTWTLKHPAQCEDALLASCDICCQLNGAAQETFVRRVEQELETSVPDESGSLMMNYDQLRTLSRHGHTVGSHTMTHPNLAYLRGRRSPPRTHRIETAT